jgi:colanic acid biosynthesis glycosyl transferase WcaI
MRILVVNQYFPPDASGSAYLLGELAEDLGQDHEVCVIAGRPSYNPEAGARQPTGVRVLRIPSTSFSRVGIAGRLANYLTFLACAAVRSCLVRRPDVILTMTDPPVVGLVGVLAAARHQRPFVLICHDVYPDIAVALGRLQSLPAVKLWRVLNRLVRRRARRIVVVGRDMAEKLADQGVDPSRISYVPPWANEQIVDERSIAAARRELGWDGLFAVMHAGNMGLAQNLDVVVEAAERLKARGDIRVVFLGEGAAKARLAEVVRQRGLANVEFLPYRPRDEAQALMAAADVHVISLAPGLWGCAAPSKTYGILAAGRPFIAAVDARAEPDLIATEFGCGMRVDPGDAEGLARAIVAMLDQPLPELGRRARQAFEMHFRRAESTAAIGRVLETAARPEARG